jgi:chaperonin GroES
MNKLEALFDSVILEPHELEDNSHSTIIIPDLNQEKNKIGKVLSIGPGRIDNNGNRIPTTIKVGDIVVLPSMGFTRFEYKGDEYWVGLENQILAKIN